MDDFSRKLSYLVFYGNSFQFPVHPTIFIGTTALCSNAKVTELFHTHSCQHTLSCNNKMSPFLCAAGWNIVHYSYLFLHLSANEQDLMICRSQVHVMHNPSLRCVITLVSGHWITSTASTHLQHHNSLHRMGCVCMCLKKDQTDAIGSCVFFSCLTDSWRTLPAKDSTWS